MDRKERPRGGRPVNRGLEVDQHRLSEETLQLVGKLETAAAQLAGLPDEVIGMVDEVKDAVRYDVSSSRCRPSWGFATGNLPEAKTHQKKAIEGFTRAEERFNKLIDRVIAEQDKVPPQVPDLDNMQLPTLEDLLARLENETDLAEELGFPTGRRTCKGYGTGCRGIEQRLGHDGRGPGVKRVPSTEPARTPSAPSKVGQNQCPSL